MCDICGRAFCPNGCPGKDLGRSPRRCAACGICLDEGDEYYEMYGNPYCAECLERENVMGLVRICEATKQELLARLGFERGAARGGAER
jgi:hypothetical protein